jgi:hypothetical protein
MFVKDELRRRIPLQPQCITYTVKGLSDNIIWIFYAYSFTKANQVNLVW